MSASAPSPCSCRREKSLAETPQKVSKNHCMYKNDDITRERMRARAGEEQAVRMSAQKRARAVCVV